MITIIIFLVLGIVFLFLLKTTVSLNVLMIVGGLFFGMQILNFISRFIPKKEHIKFEGLPVDYQEYTHSKDLIQRYEGEERFSWRKLLSGYTKGKNYGKAFVLGTIMLLMSFVGYAVVSKILEYRKPKEITTVITSTGSGSVESKTDSRQKSETNNGVINAIIKFF